MEKPSEETLKTINQMQTSLILHSYIYYDLGTSLVTDLQYDKLVVSYQNLIKGLDISDSKYFVSFEDYDGSTGMDLFSKLSSNTKMTIRILAQRMMKLDKAYKERNK